MDSTAKRSNFIRSLKKFFVDNLKTTEKIEVIFDTDMTTPYTPAKNTDKWVTVFPNHIEMAGVSNTLLDVFCVTRRDPDLVNLNSLVDTVMGYLTDSSKDDGIRRIIFYDENFVNLGGIMVIGLRQSPVMSAEDGTNYIIINCDLYWAVKI